MGMVRGIEIEPVDPGHRGRNLLTVKHIGDDDLGAQAPQPRASRVVTMHHSPGRDALFQQLVGHRAADLARGAGYQYACRCHWSSLSSSAAECDHWLLRQYAITCDRCQHRASRAI